MQVVRRLALTVDYLTDCNRRALSGPSTSMNDQGYALPVGLSSPSERCFFFALNDPSTNLAKTKRGPKKPRACWRLRVRTDIIKPSEKNGVCHDHQGGHAYVAHVYSPFPC